MLGRPGDRIPPPALVPLPSSRCLRLGGEHGAAASRLTAKCSVLEYQQRPDQRLALSGCAEKKNRGSA